MWHVLSVEVAGSDTERIAQWVRDVLEREPIEINRRATPNAWLETYFEDEVEAMLAGEALKKAFELKSVSVRPCEDRDWQSFWRSHFHRQDIGERLSVVPAWEADAAGSERVEILIEPGLSFGTGDHFTTRFCLEVIDDLFQQEQPASLLDVGTGSGILAVAAAKLGCPEIVGIENDEIALARAVENSALNNVANKIDFRLHDITEGWSGGRFDLVCANVHTMLLVEMAPILAGVAKRHLVLTGILDHEGDYVLDAYAMYGAREILRDSDGEWCGLLLAFDKA